MHTICRDCGCLCAFAYEKVKPPRVMKPKLTPLFNLGYCPSSPLCFLRAKTLHGTHYLALHYALISSLDIIFIPYVFIYIVCLSPLEGKLFHEAQPLGPQQIFLEWTFPHVYNLCIYHNEQSKYSEVLWNNCVCTSVSRSQSKMCDPLYLFYYYYYFLGCQILFSQARILKNKTKWTNKS